MVKPAAMKLHRFNTRDTICSVEVELNGPLVLYTVIHRSKGQLQVKKHGSCGSVSQLPEEVRRLPLVLIINGPGILYKKLKISNDSLDIRAQLEANIPGIQVSEFLVQFHRESATEGYLAICKKVQVSKILDELPTGNDLAMILLGPTTVLGLQLLFSDKSELISTLYKYRISNGLIHSIEPRIANQEKPGDVSDSSLVPEQTIGFAAACIYFLRRSAFLDHSVELKRVRTKHIEKNKLRTMLIAAIAFLFVICASNAFYYSYLYDLDRELQEIVNMKNKQFESAELLLAKYEKNKYLIEGSGLLSTSRLGYFADRIAAKVPADMKLTEMYFNPEKQRDHYEDSLLQFQKGIMSIKGICEKSLIVNEWIHQLKGESFIQDVNLARFAFGNDVRADNFEVLIKLK